MNLSNTINKLGMIVLGLFLMSTLSSCGYNKMVGMDEGVKSQWAQVEDSYQRRMDLVKNLESIVQGAADFEKSTMVEVTEARSKATAIQINADELTPEMIQKFEAAQSQFKGSLGRLLATFERYPDLKATQNFLEFQTQLEGTENRISVERRKFNGAVGEYNSFVRQFPQMIYSGMFGFGEKGYFQAAEGADVAPDVKFDFGK